MAPAQFQACMDKVLAGLEGVSCYIDDILVATSNEKEHVERLREVFSRLQKYNVKLNGKKCSFFQTNVKYLGHVLDSEGTRPMQNKIDAIVKAATPQNVSELKAYLGMVNYYGKYIQDLSMELHFLP